ncbi:MAG: hypothetical protein A2163_02695 [Actinobacteria bacterium RBG_13_35_12]|nr:MAG: hypothetical protein A2163_02695 [Actinobacteria bacterium RBG_13_35_12]
MNQVAKNQSPSGLAIAALVTGILGLGIVPIILGAIDLSKIKNNMASEKGKGFDIAGIVLGGLALIGWVVAGIALAIFGSIWFSFSGF